MGGVAVMRTIDTDKITSLSVGLKRHIDPGVIPRQEAYGQLLYAPPLLEKMQEVSGFELIDPKDYKEVIAHCHENKMFPMYHGKRVIYPENGSGYTQNGLNYCWAWSIVSALQHTRAIEGKPTVQLAPVSMGGAVRWRNAGNYLSSGVKWLQEHGVCELDYVPHQHSTSYRQYKPGWEDNAQLFRAADVYDTPNKASKADKIQLTVSCMAAGIPMYIAYYWWGHAVMIAGVDFDESQRSTYGVVPIIGNSHGEKDYIRLTGERSVYSEAFGIISSVTTQAS